LPNEDILNKSCARFKNST